MQPTIIPRHKTAIRRGDFSRPIKCLLRDGLLDRSLTLFDYGCGRGEDLDLLTAEGFPCDGWDPVHRPGGLRHEADIVNLGYVLNVIENPGERSQTLQQAWQLCRRLLVASAQVLLAGRGKVPVEFGDGVLTGRGTFQKFYEQGELPPRKPIAQREFEKHRDLLDPLMAAVVMLGRLPEPDELPQAPAVVERFGSLKRAFALVRRVTGDEEWEAVRRRKIEDLLVYLALSRFRRRPTRTQLPRSLQLDMRAFFGTYARACREADELLFKAGDANAVDEACKRSPVGKLLPDDLYVHKSALDHLEPLLRIYEGCGRAYLGEVEGANILKIHRRTGKLSYLSYPAFDTDPHPALLRCVRLSLRTRQLDCYDYAQSSNPPILHRKETFLPPDHPLYEKFARLTKQEEQHGLLDNASGVGNRSGWELRLREAGYGLRGHQLVRTPRSER